MSDILWCSPNPVFSAQVYTPLSANVTLCMMRLYRTSVIRPEFPFTTAPLTTISLSSPPNWSLYHQFTGFATLELQTSVTLRPTSVVTSLVRAVSNTIIIDRPTFTEIRYDTIRNKSLTWTRKLSTQLNLAHVARNWNKQSSAPLIQYRLRSVKSVRKE